MLFTTSGYMLATVNPACCICIHVQTAYLHVYHKAACRGPSSQVFACMLAALLSHNSSVTCMLTCKQIGVSIGCGEVVKTHCEIKLGLLTHGLLVLRSLKQDSVPTVAFTDSFGGVEACGTYAYYLASAFKQVYVQPEGTWGVTG